MSKTYFTADPHFHHRNIIEYCDRPFADVEEMNTALLDNINTLVQPDDTLYLVGDIVYGHPARVTLAMAEETIKKIRCRNLILIPGSHDEDFAAKLPHLFKAVSPLLDIKVHGQGITLCHYSMRSWKSSHHGTWSLFGHHHGRLPVDEATLAMDVGVDPNNYRPLSFEEVRAHMAAKKFLPIARRSKPQRQT